MWNSEKDRTFFETRYNATTMAWKTSGCLRVALLASLVLNCSAASVARSPADTNLYDVLRLIYTMCSAPPADLQVGIKCMDHYLGGTGGEVSLRPRVDVCCGDNKPPRNRRMLLNLSLYRNANTSVNAYSLTFRTRL